MVRAESMKNVVLSSTTTRTASSSSSTNVFDDNDNDGSPAGSSSQLHKKQQKEKQLMGGMTSQSSGSKFLSSQEDIIMMRAGHSTVVAGAAAAQASGENFYSITPATTHNGDYDVVDLERTKSRGVYIMNSNNSESFENSLSSANNFLNIKKHAHPFSASILKTTKSIADNGFKISNIAELNIAATAAAARTEIKSKEPFFLRGAKRLFSSGGGVAKDSPGSGVGAKPPPVARPSSSLSTPSSRDHTPEYASIIELKASGPAATNGGDGGLGVGVGYLKMFESFLQDRKKQAATVASLANSSLSLNSSKFLFGRRGRSADMKSCETQTSSMGEKGGGGLVGGGGGGGGGVGGAKVKERKEGERKVKGECKLTASRMLATSSSTSKLTPAVMNTSGLLSVNINMEDDNDNNNCIGNQEDDDDDDELSLEAGVMPPPRSSSSPSSSSSNCSVGDQRSVESAQFTTNEIEEPRVLRRQQKYLVELRAVFLKIGDIDTLNEKFMAEAFMEARWIDRELSPSVKYNPDTMWNPKLYVVNGLGEIKQQVWFNQYSIGEYQRVEKSRPLPPEYLPPGAVVRGKVGGSGSGCVVLERRRISGQFWQTLDLKNFPADVQQLTISLSTPKQANEIEIFHAKDMPSSVNHKCFKDSQEWRLYRHITVREYVRESVFSAEAFPALDFTINAARKPTFYYWNAFFLIFLITLASLSIFSIRCHLNANRIQTVCTLLLTSVTFKWITNRSLPTVSYMTSLDKYAIGCMLLLCAQIIWHAVISSMLGMDAKCVHPYALYDYSAFICFCGLFLTINFVFLFWLLRQTYTKRCELSRLEIDYANQIVGKRSTRLKSMLYGI